MQSGDPVVRQIEQPEFSQTTQRSKRELTELIVRQVQALQRSEGIKSATSVSIAVRAAEEFEGVVSELEVLQHLGLYEIVRVQLKRHNLGVR